MKNRNERPFRTALAAAVTAAAADPTLAAATDLAPVVALIKSNLAIPATERWMEIAVGGAALGLLLGHPL